MIQSRPHALFVTLLCLGASCATSAPDAATQADLRSELPDPLPPLGQTLVVTADLRIEPGEYLRPTRGDEAVVLLEGLRGVTLDLRGVTLRGAPAGSSPDQGRGQGLVLRNCEDVEVLGGSFGGYRVAIRVEGCDDVRLRDARIEPNFGMRLVGSDALPNPDDRLAVSTSAAERWLDVYGAGIALVDSSRIEVRGARVRGGQNGLVALRCEGCRILENDFSYLSGWGIALAASDASLVAENQCDVVTRRSGAGRAEPDHGAAGILLTDGSSDNVLAGNSARACTAGGRELFSSAGGGNNRWIANDFSDFHCVGLDVAGARGSWYVRNRLHGGQGAGLRVRGAEHPCLVENDLEGIYGAGIVLEGGHHALVHGNRLADCDRGLEILPGELALGEERGFRVSGGRFEGNIQDLVLERAAGLELVDNDFDGEAPPAHLDGLTLEGAPELTPHQIWSSLADAEGHLPSGRSAGSVLRRPARRSPLVLQEVEQWAAGLSWAVLPDQPAQRFPHAGEAIGRAPAILGDYGPWDPNGGAPRPLRGRARGLLAGARWNATWFTWGRDSDPRGELERWRARRFESEHRAVVEVWSDPWGGDPELRRSLPATNFGVMATTQVDVAQAGEYVLGVVSDDGVRVSIDGVVVLEDWTWHPSRQRTSKIQLDAGSHSLSLEYFQMDGPAVLTLEVTAPPGS